MIYDIWCNRQRTTRTNPNGQDSSFFFSVWSLNFICSIQSVHISVSGVCFWSYSAVDWENVRLRRIFYCCCCCCLYLELFFSLFFRLSSSSTKYICLYCVHCTLYTSYRWYFLLVVSVSTSSLDNIFFLVVFLCRFVMVLTYQSCHLCIKFVFIWLLFSSELCVAWLWLVTAVHSVLDALYAETENRKKPTHIPEYICCFLQFRFVHDSDASYTDEYKDREILRFLITVILRKHSAILGKNVKSNIGLSLIISEICEIYIWIHLMNNLLILINFIVCTECIINYYSTIIGHWIHLQFVYSSTERALIWAIISICYIYNP